MGRSIEQKNQGILIFSLRTWLYRPKILWGCSSWYKLVRSFQTSSVVNRIRKLFRELYFCFYLLQCNNRFQSAKAAICSWRLFLLLRCRRHLLIGSSVITRSKLRTALKHILQAWSHQRSSRLCKRRKSRRASQRYRLTVVGCALVAWTSISNSARQRRFRKDLQAAKQVNELIELGFSL